HILPVDPTNPVAVNRTYGLGSSEWYWTDLYTEKVIMGLTSTATMNIDSNTLASLKLYRGNTNTVDVIIGDTTATNHIWDQSGLDMQSGVVKRGYGLTSSVDTAGGVAKQNCIVSVAPNLTIGTTDLDIAGSTITITPIRNGVFQWLTFYSGASAAFLTTSGSSRISMISSVTGKFNASLYLVRDGSINVASVMYEFDFWTSTTLSMSQFISSSLVPDNPTIGVSHTYHVKAVWVGAPGLVLQCGHCVMEM
ncbi:unnamed protein product, partial [marine sediment metagenome]